MKRFFFYAIILTVCLSSCTSNNNTFILTFADNTEKEGIEWDLQRFAEVHNAIISRMVFDDGVWYVDFKTPIDTIKDFKIIKESHPKSIIIPDGVKVIGAKAFKEMAIERIELPNTIEEIGEEAFYGTSLKQVTLSSSMSQISNGLFHYCEKLKKVIIPSSINHIGSDAFCGCISLDSLELSDNISDIDSYAFAYSGLSPAILPNSIKNISDGLFAGIETEEIYIHDGVWHIGTYAFGNNKHVKRIIIPDSVEDIDNYAFELNNTDELEYIRFPVGGASLSSRELLEYSTNPNCKTDNIESTLFIYLAKLYGSQYPFGMNPKNGSIGYILQSKDERNGRFSEWEYVYNNFIIKTIADYTLKEGKLVLFNRYNFASKTKIDDISYSISDASLSISTTQHTKSIKYSLSCNNKQIGNYVLDSVYINYYTGWDKYESTTALINSFTSTRNTNSYSSDDDNPLWDIIDRNEVRSEVNRAREEARRKGIRL